MKLVKIFGIVMAAHGVAFMFIFAIPGCRSTRTNKQPVATAPVIEADSAPQIGIEPTTVANEPYVAPEIAPVRFSPTRPNTPAAAVVVAPPAAPAQSTYVVVKGDSLWSIARKHGITVKELTAANKMRADATLRPDQKLIIPAKAVAPAAAQSAAPATAERTASAPATTTVTHVIKPGETLGGIARKYHVKVGDIATANNIADPTKIRAGQTLKIPGAQASSTTVRTSTPAAPAPAPTPAPRPAPAPTAPALGPTPAPLAPVFESPVVPAPVEEVPMIAPASDLSDAPMIRVEESGAPRIE